jgi:hypothetical protein
VQTVLRQTRGGKELGEILVKIARTAPRLRDRIEACRVLLDRVYGRAPEYVQISAQNSERFTLADRDAIVQVFEEQLEAERASKAREAVAAVTIEIEAQPAEPQQQKFGLTELDAARAEVNGEGEN